MLLPGRFGDLRPRYCSKVCTAVVAALALGSGTLVPGVAGAHSPARAKRPPQTKLSAFSASPSSLTAAGGTVTLSATVSTATSCTFTGVNPRQGLPATGFPVTLPCTTGPVSTTVSIPGNGCCTLLRYRFHLTVSGTRTKMKSLTVEVLPTTTIDCGADPAPYADFEGCDLSNQDIAGNFPGIDFGSANLGDATFSGEFQSAQFSDANASGASFVDSDLTGAGFGGTTLTNTDFEGANLTDAEGLQGDDLSTVIWGNTTCPDGTNSDLDGGTCANHLLGV